MDGTGGSPPWQWLAAVAGEHGDGFYLIDPAAARTCIGAIRQQFGKAVGPVQLAYSYKTNHTPALCRLAREQGMSAEVASAQELWLARSIGVPDADIILTGVGRGPDVVHSALAAGSLVVIDGQRDADMVIEFASRHRDETVARVLLRVAVPTPAAPAPRLGMQPDEAVALGRRLMDMPGVDVLGLHCHNVDRSLPGMRARLAVLGAVGQELWPFGPRLLDLGSPLSPFDPAHAEDHIAPYANAAASALTSLGWADTHLILEPGAAIVAAAVSLVARVLDVRQQPGRAVATIAASILHSSPNTRRVDLPVQHVPASGPPRVTGADPVYLAGSTLIDGDWLAIDLPWSVLPGDFVVVQSVGAYSISLDNSFIDPPLPVVIRDGAGWATVRRRPSFEESFAGFVL